MRGLSPASREVSISGKTCTASGEWDNGQVSKFIPSKANARSLQVRQKPVATESDFSELTPVHTSYQCQTQSSRVGKKTCSVNQKGRANGSASNQNVQAKNLLR